MLSFGAEREGKETIGESFESYQSGCPPDDQNWEGLKNK